MIIGYSGRSRPSALLLADAIYEAGGYGVTTQRQSRGANINWGRSVPVAGALNGDISLSRNKRIMRQKFRENNIPMPELIEDYEAWIDEGGTLIGRPDFHTKGRGFWKITNRRQLYMAQLGTRRKKAATHFMEYIEAPREYRVHIFNGKSIRISEKSFGETGATATGDYITRKPTHNVRHVRKAAKAAVEAVGLDFGAVDVLANDTECWVLEVNSAPHLGGTLPKLYAENFVRVLA